MAAGAFQMFNAAKAWWFDSTFDWDGANQTTFRAELLTAAYGGSHNPAHDTWSDVSANVVTGGGYGPQLLATANCTVNGGTGSATGNLDYTTDIDFGSTVTITAKWLVLRTGGATATASNKLMAIVDLNNASATAVVSSSNGDFTITPNANGLFQFS